MGTSAFVTPNTGMKMKLWSLKYTPNTATAVSVKRIRIWFMPNVITLLMLCMMMDGRPT